MKRSVYTKILCAVVSVLFAVTLLCVSTSAMGFREGMTREGNTAADSGMTETGSTAAGDNSTMGDDTYEGNIDTGDDGFIGNPGTGDLADDTDTMDDNSKETGNSAVETEGPMESAVDGVANDAANAVDDVTDMVSGSMGIWGIIIVIVIIAVIAILVFVFFSKKK